MAVVGLLLLRLILCLVFVVAGVTKLVDTQDTRQTLRNFGVPTRLAAPFGLLLPLTELVTAVLLAVGDLAWWGALAAFVLLSVFTVAVVVSIIRGHRLNCRCFGAWSSKPISGKSVMRNVVLALIALLFIDLRDDIPQLQDLQVSGEGVALWGLAAGFIAILFLLLAVLVEGWFIVHLLQQNGRLLMRLERIEAHLGMQSDAASMSQEMTAGLPPGTPAPTFELFDLNGNPRQLLQPLTLGKKMLLVFVDPRCAACKELLHDINRWQNDASFPLEITVVTQGPVDMNQKKFAEYDSLRVLRQENFEVERAYGVQFNPSALVIGQQGTIETPLILGNQAIRRFMGELGVHA